MHFHASNMVATSICTAYRHKAVHLPVNLFLLPPVSMAENKQFTTSQVTPCVHVCASSMAALLLLRKHYSINIKSEAIPRYNTKLHRRWSSWYLCQACMQSAQDFDDVRIQESSTVQNMCRVLYNNWLRCCRPVTSKMSDRLGVTSLIGFT